MSDLALVVLMVLAVLRVCAIWAIAASVLWVVDRIDGWIYRRAARRRPWS